MKTAYTKLTAFFSLLALLTITGCHEMFDLLDELRPDKENQVIEYASDLVTPFGLEIDGLGNVWVAEAGTGNNDSRVSVIVGKDKVYTAIEGFASVLPPDEPAALGVSHMLLVDFTLWMLNIAEGRLYWADLTSFQPGDFPLQAADLPYQDIATFVVDYDFGDEDTEESNPYNLTLGPDGDIFIADAAANAIIRRDAQTSELSVFATFPNIPNPTEVGPPAINVVPTGVAFDGQRFYVSTLTGFPFIENGAIIYEVDLDGNVSVYKEGYTSLVDITLGRDKKPVVVQYAVFGQGFTPMTGRITHAREQKDDIILDEVNFPLGVRLDGPKTYFVTNSEDGTVLKVMN